MIVTVNTDASFREGSAGYAFWIVCNLGRIQKGGKLRGVIRSPHDAETMAIANALHTLVHAKFDGIRKVIVNTDCLPAIASIKKTDNEKRKVKVLAALKVKQYILVLKSKGISVEFRHVKAHNGAPDARSRVNEWCDRTAKHYMKISYYESKLKDELL